MAKITLRLEELAVDSFETTAVGGGAGTVRGHQIWSFNEECNTMWCNQGSGSPCWAGSWEGPNCDSTQFQDLCTCTGGGPDNTTCDVNLSCGGPETCGCAWTDPFYHGTCGEC